VKTAIEHIRLNGLFFFLALISALGADKPIESATRFGPIEFTVLINGESNRRLVLLHGDEKTAEKALKQHIVRYKGTAFLIRNHERLFHINGLRLDPNRIFTNDGTRNTLHKYHPEVPHQDREKIVEELNMERESFMEKLSPPSGGIMIALHNNSQGYSIDSEIDNATRYSIKPDQDRRDFFLCTDRKDYEILARSPFNALLQLNGVTKYNGSLSEAMGRKSQRYVNVEVRLGRLRQQKKMLEYLEAHLP
tara:strand:+ start:509 stop:1258 length:750 start_codon:yes stop_codon:yes gene_type:complete